jgi:hypothetical protein
LILGAFTHAGAATGFAATWLAIAGVGTGMALPPSLNAALSRLTGERAGAGSALITAVRQIGATFGVAVLGSILNAAYRNRLELGNLPGATAGAIKDNVSAGVQIAHQLASADLLAMVNAAFLHGMDLLLACSGAIAAASAALALAILPGRTNTAPAETPAKQPEQITKT